MEAREGWNEAELPLSVILEKWYIPGKFIQGIDMGLLCWDLGACRAGTMAIPGGAVLLCRGAVTMESRVRNDLPMADRWLLNAINSRLSDGKRCKKVLRGIGGTAVRATPTRVNSAAQF